MRTATRPPCSFTVTFISGTRSKPDANSNSSIPTVYSLEPEYDLGIVMREDPLDGDLRERARWLAGKTGLDEDAIWEWGVVERVSTGLLGTRVGLQPIARQMLDDRRSRSCAT